MRRFRPVFADMGSLPAIAKMRGPIRFAQK
jgi:hypothetical protein